MAMLKSSCELAERDHFLYECIWSHDEFKEVVNTLATVDVVAAL